jgi:acyl-CoA thioester hydrolase
VSFALPIRVYFQDTDAGGVVYHASYVNFLERARTEWLRDYCGYSHSEMMKDFNAVFVVRSLKLDYLKPALLDDLLHVTAKVKELGRSSVTMQQDVRRGEETLLQAEIALVCVALEGLKPVSIPARLRDQWKSQE